MRNIDHFLTIKDAADLVSVEAGTVRGWIRDGKLTEYRVEGSGSLRVSEVELLSKVKPMPHPSRLPLEVSK